MDICIVSSLELLQIKLLWTLIDKSWGRNHASVRSKCHHYLCSMLGRKSFFPPRMWSSMACVWSHFPRISHSVSESFCWSISKMLSRSFQHSRDMPFAHFVFWEHSFYSKEKKINKWPYRNTKKPVFNYSVSMQNLFVSMVLASTQKSCRQGHFSVQQHLSLRDCKANHMCEGDRRGIWGEMLWNKHLAIFEYKCKE